VVALSITASFTVVELVGGILSGSLALMSDAGHMFTDTLALALSLAAMRVAMRPPTDERTYGYLRAEILAALLNGSALVLISVMIFYEGARRLADPTDVDSGLMLVVAIGGLVANAAGIMLLHDRSKENLNVKGAFLHMSGDLLSSVGVIVGAVAIMLWDLTIVDPLLSIAIGVVILVGAWKLVTQSASILLESVPPHVRLDDLRARLMAIDGVSGVRDLHVWTLSSGLHAMSAHISVRDMMLSDCSGTMSQVEDVLRKEFGITHTTLQLECDHGNNPSCALPGPR
jgi:cobalt-zinc-cadmium efflux system protein